MPVLGIDLGTSCVVTGVAQRRGIDIVIDEVSERRMPACVTFTENERNVGNTALTTAPSNMQNHVSNIMRFIGRPYDCPEVQEELKKSSFAHKKLPNGRIGVIIKNYNGAAETVFSFEQLLAMIFGKIMENVNNMLGFPVEEAVLSLPSWFSQTQKIAVREAADIAGIRVLALIPTHMSAVINYGLRRRSDVAGMKPEKGEALRSVFVDVGEGSTTACVAAYDPKKFSVLGLAFDRNTGGRDFDNALYGLLRDKIAKDNHLDVDSASMRVKNRLMKTVRSTKHVLSSNPEASWGIECLMEDTDVQGVVKREAFEASIQGLCDNIRRVVESALKQSQVDVSKISSVEIYGGSTRIPAVQSAILSAFEGSHITSVSRILNTDECVAYGATWRGAFLSPGFQTSDIDIADCVPYPVVLAADDPDSDHEDVTLMFPKGARVEGLMQTFFRRSKPFKLTLRYADPSILPSAPVESAWLGSVDVKAPTPEQLALIEEGRAASEDPSSPDVKPGTFRVRAKIRGDRDGLFSISSVRFFETYEVKLEDPEAKKAAEAARKKRQELEKERQKLIDEYKKKRSEEMAPSATPETTVGAPAQDEAPVEKPKDGPQVDLPENLPDPQSVVIPEVPMTRALRKRWGKNSTGSNAAIGLSKAELDDMKSTEMALRLNDRRVREAKEAHNELESYVYNMRDALFGRLADYEKEDIRAKFSAELDDVAQWLYSDEARTATKDILLKRLNDVRRKIDPVQNRYLAFEKLLDSQYCLKDKAESIIASLEVKDDAHSHIPDSERQPVIKKVSEWLASFNDELDKIMAGPKTSMPKTSYEQLDKKLEDWKSEANKIMSKPKPAPKKTSSVSKDKSASTSAPASPKADAPVAPSDAVPAVPPADGAREKSEEMAE